jgi:septum site-determining protein MinD
MGRAIVITSGKGGVGKTTTTANLGTALALMGRTVVVVDADIGLRNLDVVLGLENRIVFNVVDVIAGRCSWQKALIKDRRVDTLFLLPASQTHDKDSVSPEQMRALTSELKQHFDYVLIDCPAGIEGGFRNSVAGADEAIVVTTPEVSAIRDADRVVGLLAAAGISRPWLIVNRLAQEMVKKGDMLSQHDVIEILSIELLGVVPLDNEIVVSTNRGAPATLGDKSPAARSYRRVARILEGEEVVSDQLEKGPGFFKRLGRKLGLSNQPA